MHSDRWWTSFGRLPTTLAVFGLVVLSAIFPASLVGQLPAPPQGVSGYTVSIQANWVSPYQGFRPVRVTIETNPAKAVADDERFSVSITFRHYNAPSYVVAAPIVIQSGNKSGSVQLYVHASHSAHARSNELLIEKGEYDGRYDARDLLSTNAMATNYYGNQPTILMISTTFSEPATQKWVCFKKQMQDAGRSQPSYGSNSPLPSFDQLEQLYGAEPPGFSPGMPNPGGAVTPALMTPSAVIVRNQRLDGIHPDYLPESWMGLSSVEQIIVSLDDFKLICSKQPRNRKNLEKWLAAGGILIVLDTGAKFEQANKILPLLLGPERSELVDSDLLHWNVANAGVLKMDKLIATDNANTSYGYGLDTPWYDASERLVALKDMGEFPEYNDPGSIPGSSQFGVSNYLNGRIVAVRDDMSTWKIQDWQTLHNTIAADGRNLRQRIGNLTGSEPVLAFKIPGVGEPPIRMFQVLISLFLLLAGPVMLVVLKKTRQMQYFFIAVPILSLAVCASLLTYAVLVDGSKKWGRAQSVTTIDHRTNLAVTHARATYYTGSRPRAYEFENDTLALTSFRKTSESLVSEFKDRKHALSGGGIRPRNPHEVTTIRSQPTKQRLILLPAANGSDAGAAPSVQNQLGAKVLMAFVKTGDGLFLIENMPADQSARSTKITLTDARKMISDSVKILSPQRINALNYRSPTTDFTNDRWGEEIRVVEALRRLELDQFLDKPNSYIAILKQFPLASEQIEPVEYKMQIHVVHGQW